MKKIIIFLSAALYFVWLYISSTPLQFVLELGAGLVFTGYFHLLGIVKEIRAATVLAGMQSASLRPPASQSISSSPQTPTNVH